jgi:hypothetical protein
LARVACKWKKATQYGGRYTNFISNQFMLHYSTKFLIFLPFLVKCKELHCNILLSCRSNIIYFKWRLFNRSVYCFETPTSELKFEEVEFVCTALILLKSISIF